MERSPTWSAGTPSAGAVSDTMSALSGGVPVTAARSNDGATRLRLLPPLTPSAKSGIEGFGLTVVEQVPIEVTPNDENRVYLETKRAKLGHRLHHQDLRFEEDVE